MLEEAICQQERLAQIAQPSLAVMRQQETLIQFETASNQLHKITLAAESLLHSYTAASQAAIPTPDYFARMQEQLNYMLNEFAMPPSYYQETVAAISKSLTVFADSVTNLHLDFLSPILEYGLSDTVQRAFDIAMPYMPEEQLKEYESEIAPKLAKTHTGRLVIGDLLNAFSLLLAVLTLVITLMPDKQQEKIIEQNNRLIELEEERLELERERGDNLDNVVYALTDAISSLSDELENIRELSEDSQDSDVPQGQDGKPNSENQNGD